MLGEGALLVKCEVAAEVQAREARAAARWGPLPRPCPAPLSRARPPPTAPPAVGRPARRLTLPPSPAPGRRPQAYQTAASLTIPPAANGIAPPVAGAAPAASYGSSGSLAALAAQQPAAAAAAAAAGAAPPTLNGKAPADGLADPLGPANVDKMNAAFVSKHQPALLGTHLFASFLG